ncbi:hypothetical protein EJB05_43404, partial [Eragrostis curvula]
MACARAQLLLPTHLLLLCLLAMADIPAARRPGCATRCGDIDVPYPFGLDPQCAIHDLFVLNCTTVGRTTKLFLDTLEVIKISAADGKIWVKNWISRQCYNETSNKLEEPFIAWMNLTGSPFMFSAEDNKVINIGCTSFAALLSDSYIIGCLSTCNQGHNTPKNGSCSGAGCCQADLPRGVMSYHGFFNPNYNNSQNRGTPCNYVALMEAKSFHFSTTYLTTPASFDISKARARVVMDWAITRNTCEEAKIDKSTPYACRSNNSNCVFKEVGYGCRCSSGYTGNPYIIDGCTEPGQYFV